MPWKCKFQWSGLNNPYLYMDIGIFLQLFQLNITDCIQIQITRNLLCVAYSHVGSRTVWASSRWQQSHKTFKEEKTFQDTPVWRPPGWPYLAKDVYLDVCGARRGLENKQIQSYGHTNYIICFSKVIIRKLHIRQPIVRLSVKERVYACFCHLIGILNHTGQDNRSP